MTAAQSEKSSFARRFSIPFRSKKAGSVSSSVASTSPRTSLDESKTRDSLRKSIVSDRFSTSRQSKDDGISPLSSHQSRHSSTSTDNAGWERDKQTGEVVDHTNLLHSLYDEDRPVAVSKKIRMQASTSASKSGKEVIAQLKPELWQQILQHLSLADTASLALSCKDVQDFIGGPECWKMLDDPDQYDEKLNFLLRLDSSLPSYLLCFACDKYHVRIQPGKESLKATNIANPVFNCPYATDLKKKMSRIRITFGRTLPISFAQLVTREHHYSPDHGINVDTLSRRYKDRDSQWSHQTRYTIVDDRLLMRVISTTFAAPNLPPAGQRHLLYSREDFVPYFSVCAHWRDGVLMPAVKCALTHIPKPTEGSGIVRLGHDVANRLHRPQTLIVTQCDTCRPLRRCPDCASEYLIEIKMAEDRTDPVNIFKHALVVTRWTDLGEADHPRCPEWAAVNDEAPYDSFTTIGKRAVYGVFEAQFTAEAIPGQRIVSMNPEKVKLGEKGHDWY